MGFLPEDFDDEDSAELWPENITAFRLLTELSSQVIMAGTKFAGFNHSVLLLRLGRLKISDDEYEALYADFRAMEQEVVEIKNT